MNVPKLGILLVAANLMNAGCGVHTVPGGSTGIVHAGATPLCDIQVTMHRLEDGRVKSVGFGVSGPDGRFALVQTNAAGPLWLSPGEYRCTVESVGPVPLQFPRAYSEPGKTPVKVTWPTADQQLDVDLPAPVLRR